MPAGTSLLPVQRWLLTGGVLITCMVIIGGVTRLTGSGLSITEWRPIMGALPPLNGTEWEEAFTKYKAIPEYTLKNPHMDLAGFKRIFFWEYLHRNWGRLMGLVFIVPFFLFLRRGLLKGWLLVRTLVILAGGGLVGALGWFMVASGLVDRPDVSHYRLAIHLCAAFTVFGIVWWTWLDLRHGRASFLWAESAAGRWSRALLPLLVLQIIWGALTAGMDAGLSYNTWPLMNGEFLPENVLAHESAWANFTDHRDGVQFIHRNLAWLVAGGFMALALRYRHSVQLTSIAPWLVVLVIAQFVLGVFTLLTRVQLVLGVVHQLGALLLLAGLLRAMHATGVAAPLNAPKSSGAPLAGQ